MKQRGLDVCGVGEGELLDALGTTLEAVHTTVISCEGLHNGDGCFPGLTDCQGSKDL